MLAMDTGRLAPFDIMETQKLTVSIKFMNVYIVIFYYA